MALGPTTPGPLLSPRVPERAVQEAAWHTCINDAWGVKPKAAPGGRDGQNLLNERWGNRRRRRRRMGAAAANERQRSAAKCARQCRTKCRRAPQERLHECRERCGRQRAGFGAVADAFMCSMVQRRVTRKPRIVVRGRLHAAPTASEASRSTSAARSAREDDGAARPMCARENGPRRRRSDDAAREM